jgi:hypothetical protein
LFKRSKTISPDIRDKGQDISQPLDLASGDICIRWFINRGDSVGDGILSLRCQNQTLVIYRYRGSDVLRRYISNGQAQGITRKECGEDKGDKREGAGRNEDSKPEG